MPGQPDPSVSAPDPLTTTTPPCAPPVPAAGRTATLDPPAGDGHDGLAAEQAYLARAREHLDVMRRRTLSLEVQSADRLNAEFLAAALWRRARSLADDPSTTLFFGRTDHDDGARWYVGRRHVADAHGDPVVIDWRAEVSRAFYRASRTEPMGVVRRRRFGVEQGRLTAYEDEHLADPTEADARSAILAREIERPRVGPMRDIVATIQPEQDQIVRADASTTVCVQGAPGTGKTAVGLHRAAWLLYAYRERLGRAGVLVVGPNASFLDHVSAVLPSLGEVEVRHTTVEALTAQVPVRGRDEVAVATLKGDARMAAVLHRAVWSHVVRPTEALVLPRGSRRWRVPGYEVAEIVEELSTRGVRYAAARDMLPQRLAHALLLLFEEAGDSPDDRVQDAVARSREVKRYVDAVWPGLTPPQVLHRLLCDPAFLAACADGVLDDAEQALLLRERPARSAGAERWSAADAVLLDEVADLLRRTTSLGHVVLDEAQDLSPMQLRAVGRRCSTGSATVLGDIAQGTTPWATPSWEESLAHLGRSDAVLEILDRGFRVPAAVIAYAARLLPHMAPGMGAPTSVRDDPGSLEVTQVPAAGLWPAVLAAVRRALAAEGSIGVVVPDASVTRCARTLAAAGIEHHVLGDEPLPGIAPPAPSGRGTDGGANGGANGTDGAAAGTDDGAGGAGTDDGADEPVDVLPPRVCVVPATTAKGLEYDRVVVVEPTAIAAAEPDLRTGLRRLYVVLTRAVSGLEVVHSEPLPEPLREPVGGPVTPG